MTQPIQLSRVGPRLSYLAFADNLLFFAEASIDQENIIKGILMLFVRVLVRKWVWKDQNSFFK